MSRSKPPNGQSSDPTPVRAQALETPAGGGAFSLTKLSIGVFLTDQPGHEIAVGSDKLAHTPLTKDEGFILPAGASGLCHYDNDHAFLSVELDAGLLREVGLERPDAITPQFGAFDPLTLQLARSALDVSHAPSTLYRETMHRALAAHLAQSVQALPGDVAALDDARLRRAVTYIHDHLADDVSLEVLAGEAAMSAFHFARAFKAALGSSPLQYVIGERMRVAGVLLKTTALPVAEIALRVGYEDTSRFGKHFKRAFGSTPAQHRAS